MGLIISILYAPFVLYVLKHFDIEYASLGIGLISLIWFFLVIKKRFDEKIIPLIYVAVAVVAFSLKSFSILKIMPLLLSCLITLYILYSYLTNNSFIYSFLTKINKKIEENERHYIHKSTLFWFYVSLMNVVIHSYVLFERSVEEWVFYSSVGWWILFVVAGLIQFVHKKFIFERSM